MNCQIQVLEACRGETLQYYDCLFTKELLLHPAVKYRNETTKHITASTASQLLSSRLSNCTLAALALHKLTEFVLSRSEDKTRRIDSPARTLDARMVSK